MIQKIRDYILTVFTWLLVLILASCGMIDITDHIQTRSYERVRQATAPAFYPHIIEFEKLARELKKEPNFTIGDIPINFGKLRHGGHVGECWTYPNGQKEIVVSFDFWKSASHLERESLVFHELGHCRLDRRHITATVKYYETYEDGEALYSSRFKKSMMNDHLINPRRYEEYRDSYLYELFTGSTLMLCMDIMLELEYEEDRSVRCHFE